MAAKRIAVIITLLLIGSLVYWASNCDNIISDEDLIRQLFQKEDALKSAEDISPVNTIYTETAIVYDGNGTADESDDSLLLNGIDEITDYYQNFFNTCENIQHTSAITDIVLNGNTATCNKITTGSHVITATQAVFIMPGDTQPWTLQKINENWFVVEATWFTEPY